MGSLDLASTDIKELKMLDREVSARSRTQDPGHGFIKSPSIMTEFSSPLALITAQPILPHAMILPLFRKHHCFGASLLNNKQTSTSPANTHRKHIPRPSPPDVDRASKINYVGTESAAKSSLFSENPWTFGGGGIVDIISALADKGGSKARDATGCSVQGFWPLGRA